MTMEDIKQVARAWALAQIISRAVLLAAVVSVGSCAALGGGSVGVQWEVGSNGQ